MVIDTFLSDKIYNFSPQKMSNFSSGLNIKQSCFRERRATNETGVGGNSVGRGGFDLVDFDPVVKKDCTFGREGVGAGKKGIRV